MFGIRMPWYKGLEAFLNPLQPVVVAALLVTVAITLWLVVKGPNWARTAWLVYLVSP